MIEKEKSDGFVIFALLCLIGTTMSYQNVDDAIDITEQRLLKKLMKDYDVDARGVSDPSSVVDVHVQFVLFKIHKIDERSQVFTTSGLLVTDWKDERLKWDRNEFNKTESIIIKSSRIWQPELALLNGADELLPDFKGIRVLVKHTGDVHWEPGSVFTTTCDIDITYFPFDDQFCLLSFGTWAYYSTLVNMKNSSDEVQFYDFRPNGEWLIVRTKSERKDNIIPCCPDLRYPYVEFNIHLRRRRIFYIVNIILPCILLSTLIMLVFCISPGVGEKISLGISVLLAFTVFLLMVADSIPRSSLTTPIIVIYLTCTMALGTVSLCLTVVVLNCHHRGNKRPVPKLVRIVILQWLAKVLGLGRTKTKRIKVTLADLERSDQASKDSVPEKLSNTTAHLDGAEGNWEQVAEVLDRLFFFVVFAFMTAFALSILLVPLYKKETDDWKN